MINYYLAIHKFKNFIKIILTPTARNVDKIYFYFLRIFATKKNWVVVRTVLPLELKFGPRFYCDGDNAQIF